MSNLKEKVVITAANAKSKISDTAEKIDHAAREALRQSERGISQAAHKAHEIEGVLKETTDKVKNAAVSAIDKATRVAHEAVARLGDSDVKTKGEK